MILLVIGGCAVMIWGIIYIVLTAFSVIFNVEDSNTQNIALYIADIVIIGIGISCGGWGVVAAIVLCIALHNGVVVNNEPVQYKAEVKKKARDDKYDNDYGVIDWYDIK